jgi:phospholipid/cholesterol/gamma-HCH transport system substrate-binding protein
VEREANYAAVGAFVLLVIVMASLFVYWYADSRDARDYQRHEIYFSGSVSGLTEGSTVRYLGVDVGRIARIRIDPRDARRVQVIADIDAGAPVSSSTVAELSLQGVTGLLYIDLLGQPGTKTLMQPVPSERYPVIRSVRSGFDEFVSGLPAVVARAGDVAERLTLILSDENIAAIGRLTANLETASRALPNTMRDFERLASDLRLASQDVAAVAVSLRSVTDGSGPELKTAIVRIREMSDNLARTSARLDTMLADNQQDLRSFARDGLPEVEQLVRDSRDAANEFQSLSRSLRDDPSRLIYRSPQPGRVIPR